MPLLFVYGTLMPGQAPACVADLVGQFSVVGPASVRGTLHDLGEYPGLVLLDDARPSDGPKAFGHLVDVPDADPALLRRLDGYEGYDPAAPVRSLFRRVRTVAELADGKTVDCQTYVYNLVPPPGRRVVGGDWLAHRRSLSGPPDAITSSAPKPRDSLRPMPKRPVIGITTDSRDDKPTRYEIPSDYAKAVERAGGLPLFIPYRSDLSLIPEYVDLIDGIVFTGGSDLDPALFGETWHPKAVPVDPDRQRFELALIAEVERRRTPALGVCLGSQLMNVHRGGTLIQFLPELDRADPLEHRYQNDDSFRHEVNVEAGTVLAEAVGGAAQVSVNSRHKQAAGKLGRGLRLAATSTDGVIEGFEDPSFPMFVAVQWHPENMAAKGSPEHLGLFRRLVATASTASAAKA